MAIIGIDEVKERGIKFIHVNFVGVKPIQLALGFCDLFKQGLSLTFKQL